MSPDVPIQEGKPASVVTEISYCPHLDVYHYKRAADDSDYMFDTPQLEKAVEDMARQGKSRDAEFMAILTGLAKEYPHKILQFDEQGRCYLHDLSSAPSSAEG